MINKSVNYRYIIDKDGFQAMLNVLLGAGYYRKDGEEAIALVITKNRQGRFSARIEARIITERPEEKK